MFVVSECLLEKLGEKRRDVVLAREKKLQEAAPLILQAGEEKREVALLRAREPTLCTGIAGEAIAAPVASAGIVTPATDQERGSGSLHEFLKLMLMVLQLLLL